jgi:hypothetical protein
MNLKFDRPGQKETVLRDETTIAEPDKKWIEFGSNNSVRPLAKNADFSIRCNFEFDSNVTDVSDLQLSKHDLHNTSTDAGIWIAVRPRLENADSSIRCNVEFDSNVTDISDLQLEKQDLHNTLTDAGTSIVIKPLPANAKLSIRCNFEFDSNVTDVSDWQW